MAVNGAGLWNKCYNLLQEVVPLGVQYKKGPWEWPMAVASLYIVEVCPYVNIQRVGFVYLLGSTRVRGCLCHGAHMKSSQGPVKYVMGCWTHHGTDSIYTKKTCQSGHGVRGPQKTYLKAYMIHCHGPTGLRWERQKKGDMVETCGTQDNELLL